MSDMIVLTEIEGYNKTTGVIETVRFCNGLAYRTRPTETPANALYRPFLRDAGWSRVDVFSKPGQYAVATPGEIVVDDSSGELGAELINYAFDGRSVVQRIGPRGAAYPSGYVTILNGTLSGPPSFDWRQIVFRPVDLMAAQSKTLQTQRYAGNNALPNGLEGVDDLKGRVKPIVLALASNMSPILVNTSRLIYHVSIGTGSTAVAVSAVRDKGVPLTAGTAYASMADLLDDTKAPAASQYKVYATAADGCYIRLGSKPIGGVTCDAAYGTAADRTHAQVWKRLLLLSGVDASDISSTDVSTLDTALPAEIEYALFDETSFDQELTTVAASAGAGTYGDSLGTYRLVRWAAPSGTAVAELTAARTESMDIADPVGTGDVAPAYRVVLEWGRNWTVQGDADLGGDKTSASDTVRAPGGRTMLAARAWLASEYRTVQAEDATVKTAHLNAVELKLTSLIADQTSAQAFADAQLSLYKTARHMTPLTLWLSPSQLDVIRPGSVVTVKQERWGYDSGRLMRVAGILADLETGKTQLNCWG